MKEIRGDIAKKGLELVGKKKAVNPQVKREGRIVKFLKDNDAKFLKACEAAKIPSTRRQASKWLNQKGAAWKARFV